MVIILLFDRDYEIRVLQEVFSTDKAELVIIYGRRRVGKTAIVSEFLKSVPGVYLFTPRGSIQDILHAYANDIRHQLNMFVSFETWDDFLEFLKFIGKRKTIVIIDEFQRLSDAFKPAITLLQDAWDRYLERSKIKLVLVGSTFGMVERLALTHDAPLFGRKTREIKISPMPYIVNRNYYGNVEEEERIKLYGVFGGTPGYFTLVKKNMDLFENIRTLILDPSGALSNAPEQLITEETRSPATYMSILANISRSSKGLPLSKIHVRKGSPTVYLRNLIKMDIVDKLISLAQGDTTYVIKDEFFRFWFTFIYPHLALIEMKRGELLLEKIKQGLNEYLSFTFEKILREIILFTAGRKLDNVEMPVIDNIGVFWKRDIELDACATSKKTVIVGEAKWINKKITRRDVERLIAKAEIAAQTLKKERWVAIYLSKKGFTKDAQKLESDNIILLDTENLKRILDNIL